MARDAQATPGCCPFGYLVFGMAIANPNVINL
jgi:hypothetical protein